MIFNDAINRLERYVRIINKAVIVTAIFEGILVIIIGIVSNNLNTDNSSVNTITLWLLLFFGALYLLLLVLKTLYNKTYPGSITNELKSERELMFLIRDAERRKAINDFLVDVIQRLNGQTCALNYQDDNHLCDAGIRDGIYNLVQPVVDNISFMLDTVNNQFTVGVYLNEYRSLVGDNVWEHGIILIIDTLNKSGVIPKNLLDTADARDEQFALQTAIRQSFNNSSFVKHDYKIGGDDYSIVVSPIPLACDENETNGVFFVVCKPLINIPNDTEVNLKIFNSVIANWVYRYNQCINMRELQRQQS